MSSIDQILRDTEIKYPDLKITCSSTFLATAYIETRNEEIRELIKRREATKAQYLIYFEIPHEGLFEEIKGEWYIK